MSPLITAVERRRRGVVAVTLDDEPEPRLLPVEDVVEHALHEGRRIDDAAWRHLERRARERMALRRGLEMLSRRQRTEADLRAALRRQFAEPEIEAAAMRLRALGYLDDATWAESYVARPRSRERGQGLLRLEMRRHGVAEEHAARALETHDDLEAALAAGRKRLRSLSRLNEDRRRRRLYDFLARRGFGGAVVAAAVRALLDHE